MHPIKTKVKSVLGMRIQSIYIYNNVDVGLINGPPPLQGQQGLRLEVFEEDIPLIKVVDMILCEH